jgi:hypothetical protein
MWLRRSAEGGPAAGLESDFEVVARGAPATLARDPALTVALYLAAASTDVSETSMISVGFAIATIFDGFEIATIFDGFEIVTISDGFEIVTISDGSETGTTFGGSAIAAILGSTALHSTDASETLTISASVDSTVLRSVGRGTAGATDTLITPPSIHAGTTPMDFSTATMSIRATPLTRLARPATTAERIIECKYPFCDLEARAV